MLYHLLFSFSLFCFILRCCPYLNQQEMHQHYRFGDPLLKVVLLHAGDLIQTTWQAIEVHEQGSSTGFVDAIAAAMLYGTLYRS